jgi:starch synthase
VTGAPVRILSVASEIFPLVKTGGLADVAGALPSALAAEGVAVRSLLPGYPAVLGALGATVDVLRLDDLFGGAARVAATRVGGIDLLVLDAPHLFDRPGNLYGHGDDAQRFAALGWAAGAIGRGAISEFTPDVVHAHDWQAALAPAYLHYAGAPRPRTVLTVHNLAFQGQFPAHLLGALRLPPEAYAIDGVEYYGAIGFLKAGLLFADRITTVSPSYADEIRTNAGGMGLGGLLRARGDALAGILNGIDTAVWNPATDRALAARFDAARPEARAANKAALQAQLGLAADPDALLVGVVSRLTWQKGMDVLADALPALIAAGGQLALLGAGDHPLETSFAAAASAHPGQVGLRFGYDEALAHLIQGGADVIAVPSRFEPCGLTQLCALRYGALPLVARVGGLADTVIDANEMALAAGVATGFQFSPVNGDALATALARAARLWREPASWRATQRNGMNTEVGWTSPAHRYGELYRSLLSQLTAR